MSSQRLGCSTPGRVGVGELVDQTQLGAAAQDRRQVHLLKLGVAVGDPPARDLLEVARLGERLDPAVGLEVADHDVAAGLGLGLGLLEHPVGLADAGGHPEEDLVAAAARDVPGRGAQRSDGGAVSSRSAA